MNFENDYERFSEPQQQLLSRFVSNSSSHIFVLKNLPEVIKGALFSRYSRSYLGLRSLLLKEFLQSSEGGFDSSVSEQDQLQEESLRKAQDFYDRILDGYGDDSIGELGGAHLAVENVSMLAAKQIEEARIGGSPLEKSTRYIYFDRKIEGRYPYYREKTLMESRWAQLYEQTCDQLFETYRSLDKALTAHISRSFPKESSSSEAAYQAALRAKVLDCLRGLLPAATLTNLGVFGNGRFFEKLLTDLQLHPLREMHGIANRAYTELNLVIPSFIRRASPQNRHWPATQAYQQQLCRQLQELSPHGRRCSVGPRRSSVKLLYNDRDAVERVLQALSFEYAELSLSECTLPLDRASAIFETLASLRSNRRHKSPRALEHAFYTFEIEADFGAYRDLQRHRMLTQKRQRLGCELGYSLPAEVEEAGLGASYRRALEQAGEAWNEISCEFPLEAQYMVPMAYHVRWYYHINLRALQWLCELRSAPAGHAEYRAIAQEMARLVSQKDPAFAPLLKFVDYGLHTLGRIDQEERRSSAC